MFKQKDEVKYQEIVEYIIERIKDKNFDRENRIAALNILILCMQVIDDELYKKEFVDFLVEKKGFCTKNIKSIYNLLKKSFVRQSLNITKTELNLRLSVRL